MSIKQFSKLNYLTKNYNISSIVGEGSYSVTADTYTVNEGSAVTYTITTTGIPDGTIYYWTTAGTTVASDFTPAAISGSVVITNNTGTVTRTLMNDISTEGAETIIFQLRRDSISGEIMATSPSVDVADTSTSPAITPYAIIPIATASGNTKYSQYKFFNLGTLAIDYTLTSSIGASNSGSIIRFGNNFILEYQIRNSGAYWVKNFTTGSTISSGTFTVTNGSIGNGFDIIKFATDKFGILYKYTNRFYLDTYSFNTTTGAISAKIASIDYGALATDSSSGTGSPMGAASVNIDINAQVTSYNGIFAFTGIDAGSGVYPGVNVVATISLDGTTGSVLSSASNGVNYSRPSATVGANGRIWLGIFDSTYYRIVDNTGAYSTSGLISSSGSPGFTSQNATPILGTNNFMYPTQTYNDATMSMRLMTSTSYTSTSIANVLPWATVTFPWTLQAAPNGCIFIYSDTSNTVSYIRYDGSSWSSPIVLTSLGSVTVNAGNQCIRIYNF